MLQINSGKLYARGVGRTNNLRGVLYSNLELFYGFDVVTAAGTLRETDGMHGSRAIVFEIEERIEAAEVGPGFLISHTIAPFLADFSALATFGLRAIISPDPDVVTRLVSTEPGLASYDPPSKFVQRYFEPRIPLQQHELEPFATLVDQLIALDRKSFLAAMRAIRTFVSGLHRMRDDLALAYTLFVSAVESLAHQFDGYTSTWQDIDERRRKPVDAALARASKRTGDSVRKAILTSEHASLARRYRGFVLSHIGDDYFRQPELVAGCAIARHELSEALRQAYVLRSRYVHNLHALPDAITLSDNNREVTVVDRRPVLTFPGLIRLTHQVIRSFVRNGRTIAFEPYNYTLEQSGVVLVPLAAELWVGRPLKRVRDARERLEGHLEQLVPVLCKAAGATVTDLRPIFGDIERLARSHGAGSRSTLLTLYALFAALLPKEERSAPLDELLQQHAGDISAPCSEALIARTLFGTTEAWPIDVHEATLVNYFEARSKPSGIQAPKLLDAAMCLSLAERYRRAKQTVNARAWMARAVEAYPGHLGIRVLEEAFTSRRKIDWQTALMPGLAVRHARAPRRPAPPPTPEQSDVPSPT